MNIENMDSAKLTRSRHDDDGTVEITLSADVGSKDPSLMCDVNVPDVDATCIDTPSNNYHQVEDSAYISYADKNQAGSQISVADDNPVITSITKAVRWASPIADYDIPSASVKDPNRANGADDMRKKKEKARLYISINKKKKDRAGRARLYTYHDVKGMDYHIPIHSRLGQKYRSFTTRNEKCEFLAKNGVAKPLIPHRKVAKERCGLEELIDN
ncbi:hypothetical protein F5Y03DRAFT_4850 [Xylaria venustula]|nr:hypothetical protein F5Y03DRAFT_4850 [Xylaria venustula]